MLLLYMYMHLVLSTALTWSVYRRPPYAPETESDPDILYSRKLQIEHYKRSDSYARYVRLVPR